jgi:hypothetical protein
VGQGTTFTLRLPLFISDEQRRAGSDERQPTDLA